MYSNIWHSDKWSIWLAFIWLFCLTVIHVDSLICSGGTTAKYASLNYQIQGVSTNVPASDVFSCENLCSANTSCFAINWDPSHGLCSLIKPSSNLYSPAGGIVAAQACVDPSNTCSGPYQFNTFYQMIIVGYAAQVITTTSIDACYSACLDALTLYGINCTSGMFFTSGTDNCILNTENRFSQPSSYSSDTSDDVYYFDSTCTSAPATTTAAPTTTTKTAAPTTTSTSTKATTHTTSMTTTTTTTTTAAPTTTSTSTKATTHTTLTTTTAAPTTSTTVLSISTSKAPSATTTTTSTTVTSTVAPSTTTTTTSQPGVTTTLQPGVTTKTTTKAVSTTTVSGTCSEEWSPWTNATSCTDNCGACGNWTKTRTCLTSSTCPCVGPTTVTESCSLAPCAYPRSSCCYNYKIGVIGSSFVCIKSGTTTTATPTAVSLKILCGDTTTATATPTASCCPTGGLWSPWGSWSKCTDICGLCGTQTRTRLCGSAAYGCPCASGDSTRTQPCENTPCTYPRYSCCSPYSAKFVSNQIVCAA